MNFSFAVVEMFITSLMVRATAGQVFRVVQVSTGRWFLAVALVENITPDPQRPSLFTFSRLSTCHCKRMLGDGVVTDGFDPGVRDGAVERGDKGGFVPWEHRQSAAHGETLAFLARRLVEAGTTRGKRRRRKAESFRARWKASPHTLPS